MPLIEVSFANTHLGIGFDGKVFFLIIQGKYSLQKFLDSSFFGTSQIFLKIKREASASNSNFYSVCQ